MVKIMDYLIPKRLFDMYGFTTDFSFPVPDFIRYPPGAKTPIGLVNTSRLKEKLSTDNAALSPKLESFVEMYLYSKDNSITLLKEENKKILKENLELKKKLESKKD